MSKIIAWTDVESAGTSSDMDPLLEVAVVLTDFSGEPVDEPYSSLITVKDLTRVMRESDALVQKMHEYSGLWRDLWTQDTKTPEVIDLELHEKISRFSSETIVFGGNSPILDRKFTELYLPKFYKCISHMTVDVTTLSLVFQEQGAAQMFVKKGEHRALSDVWDSIEEYRHYLKWVSAFRD